MNTKYDENDENDENDETDETGERKEWVYLKTRGAEETTTTSDFRSVVRMGNHQTNGAQKIRMKLVFKLLLRQTIEVNNLLLLLMW